MGVRLPSPTWLWINRHHVQGQRRAAGGDVLRGIQLTTGETVVNASSRGVRSHVRRLIVLGSATVLLSPLLVVTGVAPASASPSRPHDGWALLPSAPVVRPP